MALVPGRYTLEVRYGSTPTRQLELAGETTVVVLDAESI